MLFSSMRLVGLLRTVLRLESDLLSSTVKSNTSQAPTSPQFFASCKELSPSQSERLDLQQVTTLLGHPSDFEVTLTGGSQGVSNASNELNVSHYS